MNKSMRLEPSRGEELANMLSHALAMPLALAGGTWLIVKAALAGDVWRITSVSVYALCLLLVFLASTVYHAVRQERVRQRMRVLDHSAIFLMIAGTYTPFTLGVLRGAWGWSLFGVVWGLALTGILFKSFGGMRFSRVSLAIYLAMGWLVLVAVRPMWQQMAPAGLAWLLAGGLVYSLGVIFYVARRMPYNHLIWHVMIVAASVCHFVAIFGYSG
jgi:hemolysin III